MKVKINIKRPEISKAEIAANKNFGEVLKMYQASAKPHQPFYKTTWFYTGLSAAAAVVVAVILFVAPAGTKDTLAFITPPLEKVNIISSQYAVNADKGTTITYKTGSVVKIPPKAFVTKDGKPVIGNVDITYRELNDPIDFFISGIPMNYVSGGNKYALESAGMLEIHATQKGKELDLNPDMVLDIALASHQPAKQFSLYKFDELKKQWMLQGKEQENDNNTAETKEEQPESLAASPNGNEAFVDETTAALQNADRKLDHIDYEIKKSETLIKHMEASRPFEPKEETKGHHRFAVGISNLKDFPEFAMYKDIMFQAGDENKGFDKKTYNYDWEDAKLSKKGDNYVLTLKKSDLTASYIVHPVFEGEGYNTAQKIYKAKLAEFEETLVESKAIEGSKQQELAALAEVVKESRKSEEARMSHLQEESKESAVSNISNPGNLTFHNFTVHSFGLWNLGTPVLFPQGATVTPHFTDEQGQEITFAGNKIYLIEKDRNILFSFTGANSISYNPEKINMIWGVTADNKIAVFRYEDFKAIGKQSGSYTFKMQVSNANLANEALLEYYLNI